MAESEFLAQDFLEWYFCDDLEKHKFFPEKGVEQLAVATVTNHRIFSTGRNLPEKSNSEKALYS